MSRVLVFLRILIIAGALASVLNVQASKYQLTRLELVSDHQFAGWQAIDAHDLVRLALTAIGLSLL